MELHLSQKLILFIFNGILFLWCWHLNVELMTREPINRSETKVTKKELNSKLSGLYTKLKVSEQQADYLTKTVDNLTQMVDNLTQATEYVKSNQKYNNTIMWQLRKIINDHDILLTAITQQTKSLKKDK